MLQETSLLKQQQLLQETRFYFRSTMEFTPSIVKKNKGSNRLNKTCMKILLLSKKKSTHPIYHKNLLKNVMCTLQLSAQNTLYRSINLQSLYLNNKPQPTCMFKLFFTLLLWWGRIHVWFGLLFKYNDWRFEYALYLHSHSFAVIMFRFYKDNAITSSH